MRVFGCVDEVAGGVKAILFELTSKKPEII